ncbi:CHAT domain-containing protein [Roseomonas sp. CCTCC AB2023176]|uniref:CHAT domain-containing protein n=1 Tax=Roseomonas sp. CCTCC AB2023176 TaxID=3342640 RepID=UPI0035D993F7
MRRLLPFFLPGLLLLAACTTPPPEAFVTSAREAAQAREAGTDARGERCLARAAAGAVAGRATELFCGGWTQPAARVIELDGPVDPARLAALAGGGAWRAGLDARLLCGAAEPTTIAGGRPALMLSCRRRAGGWPHLALVAAGPGGPVLADGLPAALPVVEGVIVGVPGTRATRSAAVQLATARLSAEAFGAAEVARYEALITLGAELNQAENFAAAADAYRDALTIQEGVLGRDNPDAVTAVAHLALNLSNLGRGAEAAALFARAGRIAPLAADPVAPARVLHYRGLDAANRGEAETAARLLLEAERRYAALLPPDLVQGAGGGAAAEVAPALALDTVAQSALLGLVEVQRNRGVALARAGQPGQAAGLAQSSRDLLLRAGMTEGIVLGRSFRSEGMARQVLGSGAEGGLYAQAAGRFASAQPGERPEATTLFLSGARLAASGRQTEALEAFRRGADILRARQLGLPVALVQPYLDLLLASPDPGAIAEMFGAMQLARRDGTARLTAQASARLAASSGDRRVGAALRAMQDADRTLRAVLLEQGEPGRANDPRLAERVAEARRARDAAEDEAAAAAPGYRQLLMGAADAAAVRAVLAPDEALFVMLAGPDQAHVLALRGDGRMLARRVPMGEAAMDALVARVRSGLVTGGAPRPFDAEAAHALHAALVAPLAPVLEDAASLVIVADGPMLRLPFALLPERPEAGRDAPWLIRRHALSHMPSAQALVTLRRAGAGGASAAPLPYLGFGDPVAPAPALLRTAFPAEACPNDANVAGLLPPLPGSRAELSVAARQVRAGLESLRLGAAFTPAAVRAADPGRHRVLHFATHALLPADLSCLREPALLASAPRGAGMRGPRCSRPPTSWTCGWMRTSSSCRPATPRSGPPAVTWRGRG